MGVLVDWQIRQLALEQGMITPFAEGVKRPGVISYGLSSMGYDIRLGTRFKIFTDAHAQIIDPKNIDEKSYLEIETVDPVILPSCGYVLAESVETFKIPRDILVVVLGKSSYARSGAQINVTPGEPEWEGIWTLEIGNPTRLPIRIFPGEGIAQAVFHRCDDPNRPCKVSYKDKAGKYQGQTGVTLPRVDLK